MDDTPAGEDAVAVAPEARGSGYEDGGAGVLFSRRAGGFEVFRPGHVQLTPSGSLFHSCGSPGRGGWGQCGHHRGWRRGQAPGSGLGIEHQRAELMQWQAGRSRAIGKTWPGVRRIGSVDLGAAHARLVFLALDGCRKRAGSWASRCGVKLVVRGKGVARSRRTGRPPRASHRSRPR